MALNFKLRILLWLSKETKNLNQISAPQYREAIRELSIKTDKLLQYPTEEIYRVEDRKIPVSSHQIPVRLYYPSHQESLPIMMFFHGGGFVIGDIEAYDKQCRRLAKKTGCLVVSVDYRLAPEYKFPAGLHDCYNATEWVYHNGKELGGDPNHIITCGDSAGGNLATTVAMMANEKKVFSVAHQVLIYPTSDGTFSFDSIKRNGKGYFLTEELMRWFLDHYKTSDEDTKNPYFSPYFASDEVTAQLPPALITTAEYDPLLDEGEAYADKLRREGVEVTYKEYKGVTHVFFQMPKFLKKTREMEDLIAEEVKRYVAKLSVKTTA